MIYGIIDIGSNSIRLAIYKYEHEKLELIINKKTVVGLPSYVQDNKLSEEGINRTIEILNDYKEIFMNFNIKNSSAFATASLRNINNTDECIMKIKEKTGINIDVLNGEEEGICDFIGITYDLNVDNGILLDIGGGSTEIIIFYNKKIKEVFSIPVGSLRFYSNYVSELIPNSYERQVMKEKVLEELGKISNTSNVFCKVMCGVGGTTKNTYKLNNDIFHKENPINYLEINNISKMIKIFDNSKKENIEKLLKVCPDRIHTLIPGMIILNTICEHFKTEKMYISTSGVREGYLLKYIINKK